MTFSKTSKNHNIINFVGVPYHSEINCEAKSGVKIVETFIKTIKHSKPNCDLSTELNEFLFQHRNTPHTTKN